MFVVRSLVILSTLIISSFASASENANVRLVVTGNLMGAIRECRCPSGQPGGLARRKTIFDNIRKETPDAIFIDCGRLTRDKVITNGFQEKDEIQLLEELYLTLDYDVINSYLVDYLRFVNWSAIDYLGWKRRGMFKYIAPNDLNFSFERVTNPVQMRSLDEPDNLEKWALMRKYNFEFGELESDRIVVYTRTANYENATVDTLISNRFSVAQPYDTSDPNGINELIQSDFTSTALSVLVNNIVFNKDQSQDESEIPIELYDTENLRNLDVVIVGNDGFVEPAVEKSPLVNYYPKGTIVSEKDILIVHPGLYGEYVIVLDLSIDANYEILNHEWEAIPTAGAKQDSTVHMKIFNFYPNPRKPIFER
ncbi:MAG: hypothetical protein HN757_12645 [Calditrichaeota bacterium]|nr:hypothetical protein [Calditrichota bacterium]